MHRHRLTGGHRRRAGHSCSTFRISVLAVAGIWLCIIAMFHGATLASAWAAPAGPFRRSGGSTAASSSSSSSLSAPKLWKETFSHRATTSSPRWSLRLAFGRGGGGGSGHGRFDDGTTTTVSLSQTTSDTTTTSFTSTTISDGVSVENFALLSARGRAAIQRLIQYDQGSDSNGPAAPAAQTHVYGNWPPPGIDDDGKRRLAEQVRT
jgi:hypothetical protein